MEIKSNNVVSPIIQSSKTPQATSNEIKESKQLNGKKLALSLAGLAIIGASTLAVVNMIKKGKTKPIDETAEKINDIISKRITVAGKEFKGKFNKGMAFSENGEKFTGKLSIKYGDELGNYATLYYQDGKIVRSVRKVPNIEGPNIKEYTYSLSDTNNVEQKTVKLVNTQIIKDSLPQRISAKIDKANMDDYLEAGSKYDDIIANGKALDTLDDITLKALKNKSISHLLTQTEVSPEIIKANAKVIKNIHIEKISDISEGNIGGDIAPEKILESINESRISNISDLVLGLLKQDKINPEILENNLKALNKTPYLNLNAYDDLKLLLQEKIDVNDLKEILNKKAVYLKGN